MKNILLSLGLIGALGICGLSANEVDTKKPNKQDMELLFGANASSDLNVAVLSEEEMKETQGEFADPITVATVGGVIYTIGENNGWWNGLKKIKLKFW